MKLKFVGTEKLRGCKVGFFVGPSNKLYVCPSVAMLARDDILLLKNLKVFRMRFRNGQPEYKDLDEWVLSVSERHQIFGEKQKDESSDK